MPRLHHENSINNIQGSMSPLDHRKLTTVGPEYYNITESQDKELKIK